MDGPHKIEPNTARGALHGPLLARAGLPFAFLALLWPPSSPARVDASAKQRAACRERGDLASDQTAG